TNTPVRSVKFKVRGSDSESDSAAESSVMSASETDGEADLPSTAGSCPGDSSDGWSVCSGSVDAITYLTGRQRRSRGLMSMRKTLALLHLALVWSREALSLAHLLRLVRDGLVPYVNAYESFPEEMKIHGRDALLFRVESVPSHSSVHQEAQSLAHCLQLPVFPPISRQNLLHPELLSLQYLTDLNLPDELHPWVCRVSERAGLADEALQTFDPPSRRPLPRYDLQAAALIVVTMKLLFGLDDHTEWDLSNDAGDQDKEDTGSRVFSVRRWFRLLQAALSRARERRDEETARRQWKPQKPLYPSRKDKSVVLKRRRVAEQIQICFEKLSGLGPDRQSPAPRCSGFSWGGGGGGRAQPAPADAGRGPEAGEQSPGSLQHRVLAPDAEALQNQELQQPLQGAGAHSAPELRLAAGAALLPAGRPAGPRVRGGAEPGAPAAPDQRPREENPREENPQDQNLQE
ncbi:TATA box-binding protein-associated factor RNA polymerase I subunit B, partial [Centroberyx affinis]|uniref:TATA box-binding protein-associated factor RNA polymerase I subunit B n=1 Tax=Centroberyx affinis TaxID=166261 RepID=UPI003A5BC111